MRVFGRRARQIFSWVRWVGQSNGYILAADIQTRSLGQPSTDAVEEVPVEEVPVESTTMLLVGDVVDNGRDFAWKEILIA